ncbi:NUDIX hydrolase [Sabulicella rubraurantiaca]|uniref:NUDIX hydrolase n=1 Tax=Sabulicella rubraurantiaca TaxID=2811429 RepID=UPI001A961D28|nr:NUDIX domain-containing protein [Sabulicella rubraurantiaca]
MSTPAPVTPRPAATILLIRDGESGLEVLMVCRAREIEFASGALVFPGGRVEEADSQLAPDGDPLGAFKVAAIREAWEECGILLGRAPAPTLLPAGPFGNALGERGVSPDVEAVVPFAHWITPHYSPKRFDTHFFLAQAPGDQEAVHDGYEAVEAVWVRPAEAVAEAEAGKRRLVFATRLNLLRLAKHGSAAEALAAARECPIVTVTPEPVPDGAGGVMLRIPEEAGYGGTLFPAKDLPAMGGRWLGQTGSRT